MLSPSETGTTPGETQGTWEEPGNRSLVRVSGPGGAAVAAGWAGQPASLVRQVAQGLLHPINGGGLVLLCPSRAPPPNSRHAASCACPAPRRARSVD